VQARTRGGYGDNRYRFEDSALDPADLRARFASYTRHFDVAHEVQTARAA